MIENAELAALDLPRTPTPLADSYMRVRFGLPENFDFASVPVSPFSFEFNLEQISVRLRGEAEAAQKKEEARQKALDALQPPKVHPQFIRTASYLKGDRRIAGIASTGAINCHNYVLCPGGANIILPVPLLVSHDKSRCIGSVEGAQIDDEGKIRIWANLNTRCDASTWQRIQSGELACFSGAADMKTAAPAVNLRGIDHYFSWRLTEVSLCEVGANHECIVDQIWPPISETQSLEIGGAEAMGQVKSFEQLEARLVALDKLNERIKSLETRGAGVQIVADGVSIPGFENVERMMARINETLMRPVEPVYDANGKLIGAKRAEALGDETTEHGATLAALETHIKDLESRVVAAETKAEAFRYCGVWKEGVYVKGNFVTLSGSVWHANCATNSRPGTDSSWTLAVKRGGER